MVNRRLLCGVVAALWLMALPLRASETTAFYRADAARSGSFGVGQPRLTGTPIWSVEFSEVLVNSPVASPQRIFLTGELGSIYTLGPNGFGLWSFKAEGRPNAPVLLGDRLFVSTELGNLYCLDAATGRTLWSSSVERRVYGAPLAAANGRLFVADMSGVLHAFDANTGAELWNFSVDRWIMAAPLPIDDVVLLGSQNTRFFALNQASGNVSWSGGAGGPINTTPSFLNGQVIYGSEDGVVHALRTAGVIPQWKSRSLSPIVTPTALADGRCYVGCADGSVFALSLNDGSVLWSFKADGPIERALTLASRQILVASAPATVYALDPNGKELWRLDLEGTITADPVIWQNSLMVPTGKVLRVFR